MIILLFAVIMIALIYSLTCQKGNIDDFAIVGTTLDTCALYDGNINNCQNLGRDMCVYNIETDECLSVFNDIYVSTYPYFDWNYWYIYNDYFPFSYRNGYYYLNDRARRAHPNKYGHIKSGIRSHNGGRLFTKPVQTFNHYDKTGKRLFGQLATTNKPASSSSPVSRYYDGGSRGWSTGSAGVGRGWFSGGNSGRSGGGSSGGHSGGGSSGGHSGGGSNHSGHGRR